MNAAQLREYAARDWERIGRSKSEYWTMRKRNMSASEVLEIAAGLWEHARAVKPDWPNEAERQEDFESHLRLARILNRANQNWNRKAADRSRPRYRGVV